LICYLTNTQCGNPVSHGTRQSDSPFLSRLSPACPCLWLPQRRWCIRPHTVLLLSLGVCQGRRVHTTPAKWSSRIETSLHYKHVKVLPSFWIVLYCREIRCKSRRCMVLAMNSVQW
jgi:hypothetical protein